MGRKQVLTVAWVLWLGAITMVTVRCGQEKTDKKPGGDETAGEGVGIVPAGWDGKSDWSGSALEVVEE